MPTTPLMIRLDVEAVQLLRTWAGGRRLGDTVARLIFAEDARRAEQRRIQQRVAAALVESSEDAHGHA
jgi:hypothetical protein